MNRVRFGRTDLIVIGAGGAIGATLRWLLAGSRSARSGGWFEYAPNTNLSLAIEPGIPSRTLVVNVIGCLVLGGLTVLLGHPAMIKFRRVWVGLATGFCGSLTTFSTFAADTADLLGARGPQDVPMAATYVALSIGLGGAAFALGRITIKQLTALWITP